MEVIPRCFMRLFFLLATLVPILSVWAEEPLHDTLPAAVVSSRPYQSDLATRSPQQTLTVDRLAEMGVVDMPGALRRMAGVNLRDYGGAGGLKTVSVRGLGAAHTIVTYDGLAVGDARQGQTDLSRFSLDNISALRLVVGDGADLLTPVRNLGASTLDLQPTAETTNSARPLWGQVALGQGAFSTWAPSCRLTARAGERSLVGVAGHYYYGKNDYPYTWKNIQLTTHERREHSRMQAGGAEASLLTYDRGGGRWSALAMYGDDDRQLPGQVILYTKKGSELLHERRALAQLQHRRSWKEGRWSLMAAAKYAWNESQYDDVDNQYPGGRLSQHYRQQEWYATAGLSRRIAQGWTVAYTTDWFHQRLRSNLQTDSHVGRHTWLQSFAASYVRGPLTASARLTGYLDWNDNERAAAARNAHRLTPSIGIGYTLLRWAGRDGEASTLRARAHYKESFRAPTFTECYYYHLGEQDLRPERAHQMGAGLSLELLPTRGAWALTLTADGYFNLVRDRISAIPYNLYVWRTENVGRTHIGGLDIVAALDAPLGCRHALHLHTNYSLQCASDRTDPAARSYGKQPAYMPRHTLAASLAWDNPWLTLTAAVNAVSNRWSTNEHTATTCLPAYHEWNFGASRTLSFGNGLQLVLRADLLNAFNHQYEVIRRYPMPGRGYRLTAKFLF